MGVIFVTLILVKSIFFGEDHALVSDPRNVGTDVKQQLQFIINNPISDIKVAINHIKGTFFNFQWLSYINPVNFFGEASILIVPQLIFLLYVGISENDFKFKIKEKIIVVLSFLGVFATGSIVLYLSFTPVGHDMIQGYQTRYIFPVLPLILMIINNNNQNKSKRTKENIAIITTLFIIVDLIGSILFI